MQCNPLLLFGEVFHEVFARAVVGLDTPWLNPIAVRGGPRWRSHVVCYVVAQSACDGEGDNDQRAGAGRLAATTLTAPIATR